MFQPHISKKKRKFDNMLDSEISNGEFGSKKLKINEKSKKRDDFSINVSANHDSHRLKNCITSTKGLTGSNNWQKFLIEQGKQFVVENTPAGAKHKKNKSCDSKVTKVLGIDCEMVGVGESGRDNVLARVSIVNLFGDCLYDKFVKPKQIVTDYRTRISGVRASDLKNADDFETVQKEVAALIKDKILVGHAIKNDLEVLYLSHPFHKIRDTAKFFRKRGYGTPSLKNLAEEYLNVKIQSGEHSSIQDAQAAVHLYNMFREQWEVGGGNRKNNRIDSAPLS